MDLHLFLMNRIQYIAGPPTTGDRGGHGPPTFLQIILFKGSSLSIAVAIFWHQRLAPHFFGPVGGPVSLIKELNYAFRTTPLIVHS